MKYAQWVIGTVFIFIGLSIFDALSLPMWQMLAGVFFFSVGVAIMPGGER